MAVFFLRGNMLSEIRTCNHCFFALAINDRWFLERTSINVYRVKVKIV